MLKEEDLLTLSYAAERPREGEDCDLDSRFDKWTSTIPDPVYESPTTGPSSIDDKGLFIYNYKDLYFDVFKNPS